MPHWLYSHLPESAPPGTSLPAFRLDGTRIHDAPDPDPAPSAIED